MGYQFSHAEWHSETHLSLNSRNHCMCTLNCGMIAACHSTPQLYHPEGVQSGQGISSFLNQSRLLCVSQKCEYLTVLCMTKEILQCHFDHTGFSLYLLTMELDSNVRNHPTM